MHPKPKHSSQFWSILPTVIILCIILSLSLFIFWTVTVFLPVATVELQYQTKKTFAAVFGQRSIRQLIIPNIRIEVDERSKYPNGGIVIPSLFLDEPVIYNVDPNDEPAYIAALKKGIAHASSTRLPDNGGLGYYFAHSSNASVARQFNAVFYLLGKLNGGERITLWHEGKRFDYTVNNKIITVPEDVSFLTDTYDAETIVLQTCWPPGTSEKRLLIFAERTRVEN